MSATTNPDVSVLIITYNHEKFIRQALDSVMMQQTDFTVEIIIADDHSQDSTPDIIKEYCTSNHEIRILPTDRNIGITSNYKRGVDACHGEYIAVIEGDDFWISPRKLELLHTFLQLHPECPFCFHRIIRLEEGSDRCVVSPQIATKEQYGLLTASQLVRKNFIGNVSACMYRRKAITALDPGIWNMKVREWLFNIVVAQQGLIGYVPEILSVYRSHPGGVWSGKTMLEQGTELLELIDDYNEYLEFKFDAQFRDVKRDVLISSRQRLRSRLKPFIPPMLLTLFTGIHKRDEGSD